MRLRRVVGDSMLPVLKSGQIVLLRRPRRYQIGDIVIVQIQDREIIKRIADIRSTEIYLLGDNPGRSTDSRTLGWLPLISLNGKVILPLQRPAK